MQDAAAKNVLAPRRGVPPELYIDKEWLAQRSEDVIEPALPVVDPHHHLWQRQGGYFHGDLMADIVESGHMVRGTVFIECTSMYRADGDPRFASIGEVEFANGVGAAFASNAYGSLRVCAGIVGRVDLTLGGFAEEVMEACIARAPDRFRGVRHMAGWDASPEVSLLKRPPRKTCFSMQRIGKAFRGLPLSA